MVSLIQDVYPRTVVVDLQPPHIFIRKVHVPITEINRIYHVIGALEVPGKRIPPNGVVFIFTPLSTGYGGNVLFDHVPMQGVFDDRRPKDRAYQMIELPIEP